MSSPSLNEISLLANVARALKWLWEDQARAVEKGNHVSLENKPWRELSPEQKDSARRMYYNDPMGGWPPPDD